jgi:hypothetical protein
MSHRATYPVPLLLSTVLGCGSTAPTTQFTAGCPPRPTINAVDVEIREAGTNLLLAEPAQAIIRDSAYVDTLRLNRKENGVFVSRAGGSERPGTYEVEVSLAGYATWRMSGVAVPRTECAFEPANLLATLQPESEAVRP